MKILSKITAVAALSAISFSAAYADITTHNATWVDSTNDLTMLGLTASDGLVAVPQFDSSLGTLNSVTLTIPGFGDGGSIDLAGSVDFTNTGQSSSTLSAVQLRYADTAAADRIAVTGPSGLSATLGADANVELSGDTDVSTDETVHWSGTGAFAFYSTVSNTITTNLAPYIGVGTVDFNATGVGEFLIAASGGSLDQNNISLTGKGPIEVTYDYTPIPEPSNVIAGLPLIGFVAFVFARKRRKNA